MGKLGRAQPFRTSSYTPGASDRLHSCSSSWLDSSMMQREAPLTLWSSEGRSEVCSPHKWPLWNKSILGTAARKNKWEVPALQAERAWPINSHPEAGISGYHSVSLQGRLRPEDLQLSRNIWQLNANTYVSVPGTAMLTGFNFN